MAPLICILSTDEQQSPPPLYRKPVVRPVDVEATALGVAYAARLVVDIWIFSSSPPFTLQPPKRIRPAQIHAAFTNARLTNFIAKCGNLIEVDLSNATELKDLDATVITEVKNLENLWPMRTCSNRKSAYYLLTVVTMIQCRCHIYRLLAREWIVKVHHINMLVDFLALRESGFHIDILNTKS